MIFSCSALLYISKQCTSSSFKEKLDSIDILKDSMGSTPVWIITLNVWLAFLQILFTPGNSKLDQRVGRKITMDNHPGFISIDCGASMDYLDAETGILYKTDTDFVETGKNFLVSPNIDLNLPDVGRQLNTLRSFPDGERNCYTLKPKQGKNKNYLIRAFFAYGNYDGKNQTPFFDLYLGVNYWDTIGQVPAYYVTEIIHAPPTDTTQVCLLKTVPGTPFISALELRLLSSSIYQIMPQSLLYLQGRFDAGASTTSSNRRYKDDIYDRLWLKHDVEYWYRVNTSTDIDGTSNDTYKLPAEVLKTAVQAFNMSYALNYDYDYEWKNLDTSFQYYVYFHFAEIQQLAPGCRRIINITLNDENVLSEPISLEYLKPLTISPKNATQGYVRFTISATAESDAPPILNAFEIYKLITQLNSPTDTGDVDAILDIKRYYGISRVDWQGDPCVPHELAWSGVNCSYGINPKIISLSLSSSKLPGEIAASFSHLTELESLDLSYNELTGPLPEFLAELPKLKILNLSGNKLSGRVPRALKEKADTVLQLSLADNPDLCLTGSCKKQKFVVPLVASISALMITLLVSFGIWIFKSKRHKVVCSEPKREGSLKSKSQVFSYSEVLNITDNFKTIIGEGGFGKVYLGILQDHTQIAVKLLSPSSMQGYKEFRSEAQFLMVVHHRNLVSLIGYCDEGEIKAFIYEYMENGNLQQHLSEKSPNILKWNERLHIAVDAAHGLDYLHNGCKPPLVHRDLKTSDILLNEILQAKIADFGLCRAFVSDIDSHISTCPAGTPGYVDPEFQRTGNSNKKSDVYSFGIVLFELITGQPAVARAPGSTVHILQWVIPRIERGDIQNIVDPRLQGEFNTNSVWKVVEIALSCISPTAAERPDMIHVLIELKECLSLEMVHRYIRRPSITLEMPLQLDSEFAPLAR